MKIKFSILIPVYNVENYIVECLDSVINQSFQDFEVIIVDDGSTDDSGVICEEYAKKDSRFKVIHKENEGLLLTRKRGIVEAKGNYCLFLDSDDFYDTNLLDEVNKYLQQEEVDMLIFNKRQIYRERKIPATFTTISDGIYESDIILKELLRNTNINSIYTKVVKRELVNRVLDKAYISVNYAEDFLQSFYFIIESKKIGILNKCFYNYRSRNSGLIKTISYEGIIESLKTKAIVLELLTIHGFDNDENLFLFKRNAFEDAMEGIYRENKSKTTYKIKKEVMLAILNDSNMQKFIDKGVIKEFKIYNNVRARLYMNRNYRLLIFVDQILGTIQNIQFMFQKKSYFK